MIDSANPDFAGTVAFDDRPGFDYLPARADSGPCVSIITWVFNTDPEVFELTARSVKRQSLQQWEWLIVDDGSTRDDLRELLGRHRDADPRIRVIRYEHRRGPAASFGAGVMHACSDAILQLNSGDMLAPTAAEKWLWCLASYPEHSFVNGLGVSLADGRSLPGPHLQHSEALLVTSVVAPANLIRRSALDGIREYDDGDPNEQAESLESVLRSATRGFSGATVPEYLAWSRAKGGEDADPDRNGITHRWRLPRPGRTRDHRLQATSRRHVELERLPFDNLLAKNRPRLLLLVPWVTIGGADKFIVDLVAQLSRRGWDATVVTTESGDHSWLPEMERLTPDVFALSHFVRYPDYARFLRYIIGSRHPDAILIMHSPFAYAALPYLRSVADDIPILDSTHIDEHGWLDGGYARLSLENRDLLDLQVTCSAYLKNWLVQRGADASRIAVCYINVDPEEGGDRPSRADLGLPEDIPIIVYPCRMIDQKQPRVLAKTARKLSQEGEQFLVVVVGDGPLLPWLRSYVRRNRLEGSVRILGSQPNARTRQLIGVADCVFLPSKNEGIAATFYEAMALGVPVVGADVGGQRELVTPECGVLVERGKEDKEAERYARVLAELLRDPERRQKMGEAGRKRIQESFMLDAMGRRMESILEQARIIAVEHPRPAPSADDARRAAVEAMRAAAWALPWPSPALSGPLSWRLRVRLLRALTVVGAPVYRLGMRMGFSRADALKERILRGLFPGPSSKP